ncbi:MAG: glycosyltransferase family 39 protein [Proteobacteria bacterium]|nr:glycosyltransferase family 39 protein [Pseudomonadota bacterium]
MLEILDLINKIDLKLLYFFNITLKNPITDFLMPLLSRYGYLFFIPFLLLAFNEKRKDLNIFIFFVLTFIFSDFISNTLKNIIMRPRPFVEHAIINLEGRGLSYSMPSNHATNAFAVAFFLKNYIKKIFPLFILASLIAISRVIIGVHYPSDVLMGILLGAIVGITFNKFLLSFNNLVIKDKNKAILIIILVFLSIFRILYIKYSPIDLSGDEAHYWEWSRNLDMSYYSKGPLISYIIFIGTKIFGDTELGVKFFAVFFSFFSSLLMYEITDMLTKNKKTSFFSGLTLQVLPLFSYLGILMTIDSPFLYFWLLGLYLVCKMTVFDEFNFLKNWLYLGVVVGLGMLSKYTMVFFYPSLVLFIFLEKKFYVFKKPGFYICILTSLLIFLPVLIWNDTYGWVTLKHTAYHARIDKGLTLSWYDFFEFIISQIGLLTPFIFLLMIYSFIKLTGFQRNFTISFFIVLFSFFTLKSIQGKVEANWPLVAYPSGILSMNVFWNERKPNFLIISFLVAGIITLFGYLTPYLNVPEKYNPSLRILGWQELGKKVDLLKNSMENPKKTIIFTDDYQLSSLISFYSKDKPFVFCVNFTGRRMNQYDIWAYNEKFNINNYRNYNAIFITKNDTPFIEFLIRLSCNSYEKNKEVFYNRKIKVREISFYRCFGLKRIVELPIRSY